MEAALCKSLDFDENEKYGSGGDILLPLPWAIFWPLHPLHYRGGKGSKAA